MLIEEINKDIITDDYGDVIMHNGDIYTSSNQNLIALTNARHRLMSGSSDMYLYNIYGANLNKFIGRPVTDSLAREIVNSIKNSFTEDKFFSGDNFQINYVLDGQKILFKIAVGTDYQFTRNKQSEVNIVFSPVTGVSYV
jgi:hypothetical protein